MSTNLAFLHPLLLLVDHDQGAIYMKLTDKRGALELREDARTGGRRESEASKAENCFTVGCLEADEVLG